ncbi:R-spondin-3 [Leptonychotes weddellii]|uniref:R-spondin-3 n=1 Tax=Leptonychotes weddellii TaxID=9713 RepID=A0A7F8QHE3_LEPWE|nr:R-spondin-3 [Leptonychotes weddellii]
MLAIRRLLNLFIGKYSRSTNISVLNNLSESPPLKLLALPHYPEKIDCLLHVRMPLFTALKCEFSLAFPIDDRLVDLSPKGPSLRFGNKRKSPQVASSAPLPSIHLVTSCHPQVHPNVSQGCQGGCATCSDYNGCLSCKPRLFFVLERIGMKQIGVCLSSCPSGYYGTRYPDINKCTKCKADCDTCFNKNFCTKCKSGFYLHLGKCLDNCPEGLEANNHTMECVSIVHCEASEWSPWSPCMKKGKTCGFKRGTETRVREITQHPSAKGNLCPPTTETRKCTVQRKKCQKGERGKKGRERKRKKPNKEESKDAIPDNKGLEPSRETPEQRENKDKQQQKKRKVQDKQQKSVSVSTVH